MGYRFKEPPICCVFYSVNHKLVVPIINVIGNISIDNIKFLIVTNFVIFLPLIYNKCIFCVQEIHTLYINIDLFIYLSAQDIDKGWSLSPLIVSSAAFPYLLADSLEAFH